MCIVSHLHLLLPLCNELDLSVNELLTGERISETEYREKAEENMVNLVKEAQESKKKIILSGMVSALVIIAATPMFVVAGAKGLNQLGGKRLLAGERHKRI